MLAAVAASSPKADRPTLWIIAGANGSGKSSAYDRMSIEEGTGSVWIINPDVLARQIREQEGLAPDPANLQAVKRIEGWLRASIRARQTVGVETVLSTPKYRRLVRYAKRYGFRVRLIYVALESEALNLERVQIRVEKGGHSVPSDKILARRARSFDQLPWFAAAADEVEIIDNSRAEPRTVVTKVGDTLSIYGVLFRDLRGAVDRLVAGDY